MVQLVHDPDERFKLTQAHKSRGIAVLALAVVRICLRILTTAPKPEPATQLILMPTKTHIARYALLVADDVVGLVDGNDHARARVDFHFQASRIALSIDARFADFSGRVRN
jgi:cytochrome b561